MFPLPFPSQCNPITLSERLAVSTKLDLRVRHSGEGIHREVESHSLLYIAGQHLQPSLKILACELCRTPDAEESIQLNHIMPMPHPKTLADCLRACVGSRILPILWDHLVGLVCLGEGNCMRDAVCRWMVEVDH